MQSSLPCRELAGCLEAVVTNFPDVWFFLRFIAGFRDHTRLTIGDVTPDMAPCSIIRDGSQSLGSRAGAGTSKMLVPDTFPSEISIA